MFEKLTTSQQEFLYNLKLFDDLPEDYTHHTIAALFRRGLITSEYRFSDVGIHLTSEGERITPLPPTEWVDLKLKHCKHDIKNDQEEIAQLQKRTGVNLKKIGILNKLAEGANNQ